MVMSHIDEKIEQVLVETLEEIGGSSVRDSTLYYLKEKYHLDFSGISRRPAVLIDALKDIFGKGELLIEKKMTEKLLNSLNISLSESQREREEVSFVSVVKLARNQSELE
jgi:hypothetical protein